MFGCILKQERITILWLGEILPDINLRPGEPGHKIVIQRARRLEVATHTGNGGYNILVVQFSGSDVASRYILNLLYA